MDIKGIATFIKAARDTAPDQAAVSAPEFYPAFEDVVGTYQKKGARVRYTVNDKPVLHKLTCEDQTTDGTLIIETWNPVDAPSIWTAIDVTHAGTIDDPIPIPSEMGSFEYTWGKYYIENDVIYLCNREGGQEGDTYALNHKPSELIGHYFEVIEQ